MKRTDETKNTVQTAKAKAENADIKVTDDDKISAEGRAQMTENLKQAGYR